LRKDGLKMEPRKLFFQILTIAMALGVSGCDAEDTDKPSQDASTRVQDLHVPPLSRNEQVGWFIRQMTIGSLADLGWQWPTNDAPMPGFTFKEGKLSEALNAFCSSHGMQWRWLKDAAVIYLEPKDAEHRLAERFFQRPLDRALMTKQIAKRSENHGELYDSDLDEAWKATRKLPLEKDLILSAKHPLTGGAYATGFMGAVTIRADDNLPGSPYEFACRWLAAEKGRYAILYKSDAENRVQLGYGRLNPARSKSALSDIVKTVMVPLDGRAEKIDAHTDAVEELYRRLVATPQGVLTELSQQDFLNKVDYLSIVSSMGSFAEWAPETFGKYLVEHSATLPIETQRKIANLWMRFDQPPVKYPHFRAFWERLAKSDNPELRKDAEGELRDYDKASADAGQRTRP